MTDPWFTDPAYRSTFADVWWQARWSANPGAPAVMTTLGTLYDGSFGVIQTNLMGTIRVRRQHVTDVARKLRQAADALEATLPGVTG